MTKFTEVLRHLERLPPDFWGQVIIRIRQGKVVLLEESRTIKIDEKTEEMTRE